MTDIDLLADVIARCRNLGITVSSVIADGASIRLYTQCVRARTNAQRLAVDYGVGLVENTSRRRDDYTDWSAVLVSDDGMARLIVTAGSFSDNADWQEPAS